MALLEVSCTRAPPSARAREVVEEADRQGESVLCCDSSPIEPVGSEEGALGEDTQVGHPGDPATQVSPPSGSPFSFCLLGPTDV